MMKPTRVAALWLAVVFLAGSLFGLVAHTLYVQRTTRAAVNPKEIRERYAAKLREKLLLSPEQHTEVSAILEQTSQQFRELRERIEPEFESLREAQRQRIMAILTPEQQAKYQKLIDEHRKKHAAAAAKGH
jgi:Spy/CpxP family protein refolding chaperone